MKHKQMSQLMMKLNASNLLTKFIAGLVLKTSDGKRAGL
jgi:hypothetical protein